MFSGNRQIILIYVKSIPKDMIMKSARRKHRMCKYHRIISAHIVSERETNPFAAIVPPENLTFCYFDVNVHVQGAGRQNSKNIPQIPTHQTLV